MSDSAAGAAAAPTPEALDDLRRDVVELVVDLLRIDTSNPGNQSGPGELAAAEYAAARLAEVGIESELFTTTAPHRAGISALIPGTDATAEPLLLTGHLDVVPAVAADWTHPPFSGLIDDDGVLWGRGAVDMKDMVGMILAVARHWARTGTQPRRPVAILLTPDEEAGGQHGAHWIVNHRPELLHGATDALGEVGGFSITLPNGRRLYAVQSAEKGLAWFTATVHGQAGHGSLLHQHNPVEQVARSVTELMAHPFDISFTDATAELVATLERVLGEPLAVDDNAKLAEQLGPLARVLGASLRTLVNPTMLNAGYKHNIVPGQASVGLDLRFLPGQQAESLATVRSYFPDATQFDFSHVDIALETPFVGALPELLAASLQRRDPDAAVAPFLMTGGTDGKAFSTLGVRYFGFSPLRLPADLDFWSMFHAADERVPVEALEFGAEVLEEVSRTA